MEIGQRSVESLCWLLRDNHSMKYQPQVAEYMGRARKIRLFLEHIWIISTRESLAIAIG